MDRSSIYLTSFQRVAGITTGSILIGLLATAATLNPSQYGFGTHEQFGLPACPIQMLYAVRCPACGMTTSWAHVTRGQLAAALRANGGGTLLAGCAMIASPWLLISGFRGTGVGRVPNEGTMALIAVIVLLVTVFDLGWRLLASWR